MCARVFASYISTWGWIGEMAVFKPKPSELIRAALPFAPGVTTFGILSVRCADGAEERSGAVDLGAAIDSAAARN